MAAQRNKAMKQIIKVRCGAQGELAKRFGCGNATVSMALHYKIDSDLARKIRLAANEQQYMPIPPKPKPIPMNDKTHQEYEPICLIGGGKEILTAKFGCSGETVRNACNFKFDSQLCRNIRQAAVELNLVRDTPTALLPRATFQPLGIDLYHGAILDIAAVCGVNASMASSAIRGGRFSASQLTWVEKVRAEAIRPQYREPEYTEKEPVRILHGGIPLLVSEFGCSESMIKKAFKWELNTELAQSIRAKAMKMNEVQRRNEKIYYPAIRIFNKATRKEGQSVYSSIMSELGCQAAVIALALHERPRSVLQYDIRRKVYEMEAVKYEDGKPFDRSLTEQRIKENSYL